MLLAALIHASDGQDFIKKHDFMEINEIQGDLI